MDSTTRTGRGLHAYTKVAVGAAGGGFLVNASIGGLRLVGSPLFFGLAFDNVVIGGLLAVATVALGSHALVKYRWPGGSALEVARKPGRRDLRWIGGAFGLTALNLAALAYWFSLAEPFWD